MIDGGYLPGMKLRDILFLICTLLYFVIINKTRESHARITITKILAWDCLSGIIYRFFRGLP